MRPRSAPAGGSRPDTAIRRRVQRVLQAHDALALAECAVTDPEAWPVLSAMVRADGPYLPHGAQSSDVRQMLATVQSGA